MTPYRCRNKTVASNSMGNFVNTTRELNPVFKLKVVTQNLITKTSFQILFTLLCPRIVNYRIEPPRASCTPVNLPQIESDKTLNIHKQMCKFC